MDFTFVMQIIQQIARENKINIYIDICRQQIVSNMLSAGFVEQGIWSVLIPGKYKFKISNIYNPVYNNHLIVTSMSAYINPILLFTFNTNN